MKKLTNLNRIAAVLVLAVLALPATVPAQEEVCEIPLFVRQSKGTGNVMIVCDNSYSMNEAILHDAYNKNITWTGNFDPAFTYYVAQDGDYAPADFIRQWEPAHPWPWLRRYGFENHSLSPPHQPQELAMVPPFDHDSPSLRQSDHQW